VPPGTADGWENGIPNMGGCSMRRECESRPTDDAIPPAAAMREKYEKNVIGDIDGWNARRRGGRTRSSFSPSAHPDSAGTRKLKCNSQCRQWTLSHSSRVSGPSAGCGLRVDSDLSR